MSAPPLKPQWPWQRPWDTAQRKIAELEKQFWVCDYIGTTRGIEGPHGVACGANYEELKQTKFGGDFEKLVTWWRLNKIAQHQALESAGSAQY